MSRRPIMNILGGLLVSTLARGQDNPSVSPDLGPKPAKTQVNVEAGWPFPSKNALLSSAWKGRLGAGGALRSDRLSWEGATEFYPRSTSQSLAEPVYVTIAASYLQIVVHLGSDNEWRWDLKAGPSWKSLKISAISASGETAEHDWNVSSFMTPEWEIQGMRSFHGRFLRVSFGQSISLFPFSWGPRWYTNRVRSSLTLVPVAEGRGRDPDGIIALVDWQDHVVLDIHPTPSSGRARQLHWTQLFGGLGWQFHW